MIRQDEPKPKWTAKRAREFDLHAQYNMLKMLGERDPVSAVAASCGFTEGAIVHAKRFLHDMFQDLPELRTHFPQHAERFGPYTDLKVGAKKFA